MHEYVEFDCAILLKILPLLGQESLSKAAFLLGLYVDWAKPKSSVLETLTQFHGWSILGPVRCLMNSHALQHVPHLTTAVSQRYSDVFALPGIA